MIFDIPTLIMGLVFAVLGSVLQAATALLNFPSSQITAAVSTVITPAFYFKGIMHVQVMLNVIGYLLGFFSTLFMFNGIMYIWAKVPIFGKGRS